MANFSFPSLFQIGLLFVLICWTKESTGASFSLKEEFKELKENYVRTFISFSYLISFFIHYLNNFKMFHSNLAIDSNERNCKEFGVRIEVISYRIGVRSDRIEGQRRSNAGQNDKFGEQSDRIGGQNCTTRIAFIRPVTREKRTHRSSSQSISSVHKRTSIVMRWSRNDWPHPEWILFYRRIGDDGICLLRFL